MTKLNRRTNRRKVHNLERFVKAQDLDYDTALSEIKGGFKRSHWIWYVFPQLAVLGRSEMAKHYGIKSIDEARAYLSDDTLRSRLEEITKAFLSHCGELSAFDILGRIDEAKMKSSMTLFDFIAPNSIYGDVLDGFYGGNRCEATLEFIRRQTIEQKKKERSDGSSTHA